MARARVAQRDGADRMNGQPRWIWNYSFVKAEPMKTPLSADYIAFLAFACFFATALRGWGLTAAVTGVVPATEKVAPDGIR